MKQLIPMDELVFNYKDTPYTDSFLIAKGGNVDHASVMRLITNHVDDVAYFGRVRFEIRPLETKGGVQKVKSCKLNKEQATFLITLMKNTKRVVAFKKELVKQFYQMEEFIRTLIETRKDFPLLTDNIKMLHENPKPYHFSNECDMINRLVTGMTAKQFRETNGLQKGESIRPHLTGEQIWLMNALQKADIGLMISEPSFEARKHHLEWYKQKLLESKQLKGA